MQMRGGEATGEASAARGDRHLLRGRTRLAPRRGQPRRVGPRRRRQLRQPLRQGGTIMDYLLQEKLLSVTLVTVTQYRAIWSH